MKAVRYHEYGEPSVLRYEDVERPHPKFGQVLIRVAATAFNALDATMRAGYMQQVFSIQLPHTPRFDVSGTVAELGNDVDALAIGDAVIGFLPMTDDGAAAEFVVAPADMLTSAPKSIPLVEAAALPSASLTAWQALFEHTALQAGQRILINGAGGGVGGFAVQLAKGAGATVLATASGRSAAAVKAAGADHIVDYTREKLTEAVTEPVDVVLNLVRTSDEEMSALVGLARNGGVLVTTTSPAHDDSKRDVRSVSMYVHPDPRELAAIVAKVDNNDIHIDVSATYPLSDLAQVHELSAAGKTRGKVLFVPPA